MPDLPARLTPVIVGIGEVSEHGISPSAAREPIVMMQAALMAAQADSGASNALSKLDSLDVVMPMSWRYEDLPGQLSARIGASPAHAKLGPSGGESPLRYIHRAAKAIARGEASIAAVVGGESQEALITAQRAGQMPEWTPYAADGPSFADVSDAIDPLAASCGLYLPIHVYGLYEAANAHAAGQSPGEARAQSADIWARYSRAAARNPHSKIKDVLSAGDIAVPTAKNRLIGGPYTRSMVANMNVNQSAAVLIMSAAAAREAGIPDNKRVHISAGAHADEPRNFLRRDRYDSSAAQTAVLRRMQSFGDLGALELYSCFPVVPKMAAQTLGLPEGFIPTVTGGLSFFGAPLNNYMTHAACAMVREIRGGAACGTLYGQGEYVTKHYGLRLSATPESLDIFGGDLQSEAGGARGPAPHIDGDARGPATIMTFTTFWNRDNTAEKVIAIARTDAGPRTLVTLKPGQAGFETFLSDAAYPIGMGGQISDTGNWQPEKN